TVEPEGDAWRVQVGIAAHTVTFADPLRPARGPAGTATLGARRGAGGQRAAVALMPGKIARVLVGEGDSVPEGQGIVGVEAMKMENEVLAPASGRVVRVKVAPGETVEAGAELVVIG